VSSFVIDKGLPAIGSPSWPRKANIVKLITNYVDEVKVALLFE